MKTFSLLFPLIILCSLCCSSGDNKVLPQLDYINNEFGFTIRFPERWENYRIFESMEVFEPGLLIKVFYVSLPTRSRDWQPANVPANFAALFSIYAFTNPDWVRFSAYTTDKKEDSLSEDSELARSDRYVFMIRYSQSLPVDLYLFMKDIKSVSDSFTVIEK
jgi:hypothetical protein